MSFETVLIVEDEPDIQLVTELALGKVGKKQTKVVANGIEALEVLEEWRPDVILMDVMMPLKSGPDTLREILSLDHLKDIPVIFMTAKSEGDELQQYIAMGAKEVITKPFDPMTLCQQIEEILT